MIAVRLTEEQMREVRYWAKLDRISPSVWARDCVLTRLKQRIVPKAHDLLQSSLHKPWESKPEPEGEKVTAEGLAQVMREVLAEAPPSWTSKEVSGEAVPMMPEALTGEEAQTLLDQMEPAPEAAGFALPKPQLQFCLVSRRAASLCLNHHAGHPTEWR